MGLLHGSCAFTRFIVSDALPQDYREEFPIKISRFAFRGLDEISQEERSVGWVNIMDMFDSRFPENEFFKDPYIALSWRVDVRRVPAQALKQACRQAENDVKKEEGLEFLPKSRRQEIKESLRLQLLKRAIPSTKTYDMVWDSNSGLVLFSAVNNRLCDEFAEYFQKTFELGLTSVYPLALARQTLEKDALNPELLEALGPSIHVGSR
jgi:DNA recombination-dependent growth factor C